MRGKAREKATNTNKNVGTIIEKEGRKRAYERIHFILDTLRF